MSEAIASTEERLAAYNANVAAAEKDPRLSPETGKPLDKVTMFRFGAGFIVFGLLWMSGLGIVSAVLLPMHYKTIPGVNADALVGIVNAFTAVASLVANLMFGNFSDRSRSRFGRRTPWILFGAVLGGVTLFLTGTTHNAVLLTIFYCACMFGLNCMIAPMVAILSDRVPSKIRGTMSAFYGAGSTIGAPIGTMLGALFIENLIPGFAVAGVLMFLGGVVAVIILPKEQSADFLPKDEGSFKDILVSFRPPKFSTAAAKRASTASLSTASAATPSRTAASSAASPATAWASRKMASCMRLSPSGCSSHWRTRWPKALAVPRQSGLLTMMRPGHSG